MHLLCIDQIVNQFCKEIAAYVARNLQDPINIF